MEVKIDTTGQVVLVIGDKRYSIRRPKIREARKLEEEKKLAESGKASYLDIIGNFLFEMGLPKEQYEDLDVTSLEQIMSALTGDSKKN